MSNYAFGFTALFSENHEAMRSFYSGVSGLEFTDIPEKDGVTFTTGQRESW